MRLGKLHDGTLTTVASAACFIYYYFIAHGTKRCHMRTFRNFTTTWRTFGEAALGALRLVRLTTKLSAFYLAALNA